MPSESIITCQCHSHQVAQELQLSHVLFPLHRRYHAGLSGFHGIPLLFWFCVLVCINAPGDAEPWSTSILFENNLGRGAVAGSNVPHQTITLDLGHASFESIRTLCAAEACLSNSWWQPKHTRASPSTSRSRKPFGRARSPPFSFQSRSPSLGQCSEELQLNQAHILALVIIFRSCVPTSCRTRLNHSFGCTCDAQAASRSPPCSNHLDTYID